MPLHVEHFDPDFADNRASRSAPAGTVARGWLRADEALYTGKVEQRNGQYEGFIDLSGRASGVYLLRVQHGPRQYTKKLVVQR